MTTRFSKRLELDYSIVLVAIFDLMLTGGIQAKDLLAVCTRALKQAEARVRLGQRREPGGLLIAALVFRRLASRPPLYKRQSGTKSGPSSWASTERRSLDSAPTGATGRCKRCTTS